MVDGDTTIGTGGVRSRGCCAGFFWCKKPMQVSWECSSDPDVATLELCHKHCPHVAREQDGQRLLDGLQPCLRGQRHRLCDQPELVSFSQPTPPLPFTTATTTTINTTTTVPLPPPLPPPPVISRSPPPSPLLPLPKPPHYRQRTLGGQRWLRTYNNSLKVTKVTKANGKWFRLKLFFRTWKRRHHRGISARQSEK